MKWFKEKEFACRCCGELPPLARANVRALVDEVLDPVREKLGKAIVVNSGYRCPRHNAAVGGVRNSQHLRGEAADIRICGITDLRNQGNTDLRNQGNTDLRNQGIAELVEAIKEHGVFDQLIVYPGFVHVSYKRNGGNRGQVLKSLGNGRYQAVSLEEILHGKTAQHTTERRAAV